MEKVDIGKKQNVDVHYVNSGDSCFVEENFDGYYPDLHITEILQIQESLYRSLPENGSSGRENVPSSSHSKPDSDHGQDDKSSSTDESFRLQLALDETMARSLQELENHLTFTSLNGTEAESAAVSTTATSTLASMGSWDVLSVNNKQTLSFYQTSDCRARDIDPDNMTYEELQSLGESIGTENKGLSDEIISFLPLSTYKTGLFSKKDKHDCVICYMPYKNRERLITLPCHHHYHANCITRWLKINKACPVCNEEVFGS